MERLRAAGVQVTEGVLERECRWTNRRFNTRHEQGRPYVVLKWASTSDGLLDKHPWGNAACSASADRKPTCSCTAGGRWNRPCWSGAAPW